MTLNALTQDFVVRLASELPEGTLRLAEPRYLQEPRGRYFGAETAYVARPRNVEDVAHLLRACNAARVGVVPYGGGTGLVGGQVMPEGPAPLLVSLERMKAIRAVYPGERVPLEIEWSISQAMRDKLIEHREYIEHHGQDMPEVLGWRWRIGVPQTDTALHAPDPGPQTAVDKAAA